MTSKPCLMFAALSSLAVAALGQQPPASPISASHGKMFTMLSGVVIAAAEKMPEDNYSFKPAPDVRSFGQLVGHLADSQFYFCGLAGGEEKRSGGIERGKTSKAELINALKEAVAFCGKTYAAMTDARGAEPVKLMGQDFTRLTVLAGNTAHNYEHYGNMATYMRIKGIVPPTSEPPGGPGQGAEKHPGPEKK